MCNVLNIDYIAIVAANHLLDIANGAVTPTPWPTSEARLAESDEFLAQIISKSKNDSWFLTHPGQAAARDALPVMGGESMWSQPPSPQSECPLSLSPFLRRAASAPHTSAHPLSLD